MKVRCRTLRSLFSSLVVVGLVSGCSSAPVDSAPVDPRFAAETYDEYTEPLTNAVIGTPEGITVIRPVGEQTGTAASALGADGGPTGGTGGSSGAGSGVTVTGVGGSTVSGAGRTGQFSARGRGNGHALSYQLRTNKPAVCLGARSAAR